MALLRLAEDINNIAIYTPHGRGLKLRDKYLKLRDKSGRYILKPFILTDLSRRKGERFGDHLVEVNKLLEPFRVEDTVWWDCGPPIPPQSKLTAKQQKLVANNQGDVRKFAEYFARGDEVLAAELEALGLSVLEELAPRYDPTRGATFRTFASRRLRGAMIDHINENKNRTVAVGDAQEVDLASLYYKTQRGPKTWAEENNKRGRVRHQRGGTVKILSSSGRSLPSGDMTLINTLLLKLNPKQRAVYRDMVLTEPPLSRAAIARKLGIRDVTQISRILRQAQKKMNKWLLGIEQKTK